MAALVTTVSFEQNRRWSQVSVVHRAPLHHPHMLFEPHSITIRWSFKLLRLREPAAGSHVSSSKQSKINSFLLDMLLQLTV